MPVRSLREAVTCFSVFFVFVSMILRPPRSTLFPSPTLFRSGDSPFAPQWVPRRDFPADLSTSPLGAPPYLTAQFVSAHLGVHNFRNFRVCLQREKRTLIPQSHRTAERPPGGQRCGCQIHSEVIRLGCSDRRTAIHRQHPGRRLTKTAQIG